MDLNDELGSGQSSLEQKLKIQTETYEKFVSTYYKVLECISQNNQETRDLKKTLQELSQIVADIKGCIANNETFVQELSKELKNHEASIDGLRAKILQQHQEIIDYILDIVKNMQIHDADKSKLIENVGEQTKAILEFFTKFKEDFQKYQEDENSPRTQIDILFKEALAKRKIVHKALIYFFAILTIVGILGTLMQLNIINIIFFPK